MFSSTSSLPSRFFSLHPLKSLLSPSISSLPSSATSALSSPSNMFLQSVRSRTSRGEIWQKATRKGIYGRKHIMFGNNVPFSEKKTRRIWLPNVVPATVYSELLDKEFKVRITAYALRCIDKAGGLDNYLCKTDTEKLGQGMVISMRDQIMPKFLERKAEQRKQNQTNQSHNSNSNTENKITNNNSASTNNQQTNTQQQATVA
jgi:large subunit ribosomal protein L28